MEHATPASERILHIKEKRICLDSSAVLYARPFDEQSLREDFEATGGQWRAEADGWIVGETKRDGAGILYSRASYEGDILLDFIAQPVPPCCNDLNFAWKASGWNYEKDDADKGYIGGLGGWWLNRASKNTRDASPSYPPACTRWKPRKPTISRWAAWAATASCLPTAPWWWR